MTTGSKFLDEIGIVVSCRKVETSKIAKEYADEYTKHMCAWLVPSLVSCLEFFNPKTSVTEHFLFSYNCNMYEVPSHFLHLVICSRSNYYGSQTIVEKLRRLFGNDFQSFLHDLVETEINKNEENGRIGLLALAMAGIPETSIETMRLILKQELPISVEDKVMEHRALKNLVPFR